MTAPMLAYTGGLGQILLQTLEDRAAPATLLLDAEAAPPAPLTRSPAAYTWPTWTGDGAGLLISTLEFPRAGEAPAQLLRINADGSGLEVLYRNPEGTSLMGPRLPHYLNPSPDGQHVAVLGQTLPGALTLLFVDARGRGHPEAIARGAPLFTAWSPGSDALLLHVGGELSLMELASAPSMQRFATNHVGYRVPAWSPDGRRFAASVQQGGRALLQLLDRSGATVGALGPASPSAAFAWSPDGAVLVLSDMTGGNSPRYQNLRFVAVDGGAARTAFGGDALAFAWSPDGAMLAVLAPTLRARQAAWVVVDREGGVKRRFPPFEPSAEYNVYLSFFDQYALSHRLWSPDGRYLVSAGRMQLNGTPPELQTASIYLLDVESGTVEGLAAGTMAVWRPAGP